MREALRGKEEMAKGRNPGCIVDSPFLATMFQKIGLKRTVPTDAINQG